MNSPSLVRLSFKLAILFVSLAALALAPRPALAQHGGGHGGGGGHFGGGGFGGGHFGGGSSGSHGSSSSSNSNRSTYGSHSSPGMIVVSGDKEPSSSKPSLSTSTSASASSSTRLFGSSLETNAPKANGFAGFVATAPETQHVTIGFPPAQSQSEFTGAALHVNPGAALSFSGQGHEIWQNTTAARPSSQAPALTARFNPNQSASRFTSPRPPHIARPPVVGVPYYPGFFPGYSPFFGLGWGCDPFDAWDSGFGCGGLGYGWGGGYGYGFSPYGYGLGYGYSGGYGSDTGSGDSSQWNYGASAGDDAANAPSPNTWQANGNESEDVNAHNTWVNPPAQNSPNSAAAAAPDTVIYLQDGSSYEVKDYWLSENKLHYVTSYGGENSVDVSRIDMQRTVDANASHGVSFTLHPAQPTPLTPPPANDNPPPQQ